MRAHQKPAHGAAHGVLWGCCSLCCQLYASVGLAQHLGGIVGVSSLHNRPGNGAACDAATAVQGGLRLPPALLQQAGVPAETDPKLHMRGSAASQTRVSILLALTRLS